MTEQNARDLFKAAYEHRYTWDSNFPGYSADIELKQGSELYNGQISIKADFSVEVTGISDEEVQQSVYTQLRDVVTHRKRSSFEASHGKNSFSLGDRDETGAVEILVEGDAMGSNYKVRGREICLVSRVMGRMAFVINTHKSLDTGEGFIATHYNAIFRNPQTNEIIRELEFEDSYEKIGSYYIMTRQVVNSTEKGQVTTTEFNYSNIKLLEPAVV
ncbi:MAG: DUF3386 domain-containing protein [Okeania sp. SIO2G4]|uniref:DUF3386 domain-containing protein n=1 Tax=unclassified Okeania TaxID=2634635 RepID=UPI0013BDCB8D|nr:MULTISPECIES: DUF3386 domain-containing protein [unclassified Okeania]NEP04607.1 DUF3386 domain-containing protein [Okeania sp. SIO4D6]NEP38543.1 DUF3386 domain-containing protein [Okeania sp. SIO2H7]NEP70710.1 DUF3386 domain-containing protein [Okeania sp. SIO2G5]NEP93409.1 DUF3386 domain-containing protein [Okeania sp. SIO2F5]NEQ89817.1 DUF3386 domain-containing protein [Okeania sp. SIO2G4]